MGRTMRPATAKLTTVAAATAMRLAPMQGLAHRVSEGRPRGLVHHRTHRVAREVTHRLREVAGADEQDRDPDRAQCGRDDDQEGEQQSQAERQSAPAHGPSRSR